MITPPQTPPNPPVTTTLPDNVDHDPFAGLPELPRNRHVLPPLKGTITALLVRALNSVRTRN